ncbi:MAG: SCO family protein [Planctomycetota bacterium]|jgi:hypothetical protein
MSSSNSGRTTPPQAPFSVLGAVALAISGLLIVMAAAPMFLNRTTIGANGGEQERITATATTINENGESTDTETIVETPGIGTVGTFEVWPLPKIKEVPDFSFTERNGDTVTKDTLLGKVWVVDFIFTNCAGTCPIMSDQLTQIHASMKPEDDAACVSVSVDPERDTLEVLKEYAAHYNASKDRWLFLRGPVEDVLALSYGGLNIGD